VNGETPRLRATFAPFERQNVIAPVDVPGTVAEARQAILRHVIPYAGYAIDVSVSADLRFGSVWVGAYVEQQGWTITLEPVAP
jgi:hypothetical protein